MSLYESVLRPLAFKLDPEWVHERALAAICSGGLGSRSFTDPRLEQTLFGVRFLNPVGLAAGFDKNARALNHWHRFGFGYVECGTVTALAQPGNPKPRMFRLPESRGLINRLGFNNEGALRMAARIAASKPQIPIGVNIGKSKVTELDQAPADYYASAKFLLGHGDYMVVNVSSPNTPGLRRLQEKGFLKEIITAIRMVDPHRPLFVKVAPDLAPTALDELIEMAVEEGLTGLIATNTTIARDMLPNDPNQIGGLSGAPLFAKSNEVLAHIARQVPKEMILIGVGGIFTADDLYEKIRLGAHLTQLYTGWIYGGPGLVPDLLEGLVKRMDREGIKSLAELRGSGL